jgi:hypothetical protein
MTTTTTTRETQLEQRVAELENVLAALIRATYAATVTHFGTGNGWEGWQRAGASHDAILALHGYLRAHPAPEQD